MSRDSRKSQQLRDKLMSDANENARKAVEHKNKLLEYNRTSTQRTKVIDDDSDYFSSDNKWLTQEQREKVRKHEAETRAQHEASRKTQRLTFDFAGRRVLTAEEEEKNVQALFENMLLEDVGSTTDLETAHFVDPALDMPPPEYIDTGGLDGRRSRQRGTQQSSLLSLGRDGLLLGLRVQDRSLMQMSDDGFALSIQQPFASLIVASIKKHEGRPWFTSYRGRLWIHAGARPPSQEDVVEVLDYYKSATQGQGVKFPEEYPTGCLLGCIDLVDCVPQDEYREQFPFGECFSPYVFICDSPQELKIKFPMKGKHKIFKIDTKLHQAAMKMLLCPQILKNP